jgi:hypothetical protein
MTDPNGLVDNDLTYRLKQRVGGYGRLLRWYRRLRPRWLWRRTSPLGAATIRFVDEYGLEVRGGAFKGMAYPPSAVGVAGFLPAKLLGCYETEVMEALETVTDVEVFVDIGSGDGYYPVGMGLRFPNAELVAFEADDRDRRLSRELARLNEVTVTVRGVAGPAELNQALPDSGRLLILCDIEGAEREVLDPTAVPALREAHMIVELHPEVVPEIEEILRRRFSETHHIDLVHGRDRSIERPELASWAPALANCAVSDGRATHGLWMVLVPERR